MVGLIIKLCLGLMNSVAGKGVHGDRAERIRNCRLIRARGVAIGICPGLFVRCHAVRTDVAMRDASGIYEEHACYPRRCMVELSQGHIVVSNVPTCREVDPSDLVKA